MSSTALHVKHEAHETDDPMNGTLDALESLVRVIVANGGEAALRARLARLLPVETEAPASPSVPAIDPLDAAALLAACRTLAAFKLTGDIHASIARVRPVLAAWIAAANKEVRP